METTGVGNLPETTRQHQLLLTKTSCNLPTHSGLNQGCKGGANWGEGTLEFSEGGVVKYSARNKDTVANHIM